MTKLPPLPDYRTPGWRLVSPRAVQVLMTIHARYIEHGHGHMEITTLAECCGCGRAAITNALGELLDLEWLAVEPQRDAQGRHAGIAVRLLAPPTELADMATLRYANRIAGRRAKADCDRQRLLDELPHRVRDDVAAYIDAKEGWATVQAALGTVQGEIPAEPPPDTAEFRDGDPTIRIFSA